jgi:hypothetical protein
MGKGRYGFQPLLFKPIKTQPLSDIAPEQKGGSDSPPINANISCSAKDIHFRNRALSKEIIGPNRQADQRKNIQI